MDSFRDRARAGLQQIGNAPPDGIRDILREEYPDITLEEAGRVRDSMVAMLTAKTQEEKEGLEKEYTALHAELKKKYKKSGE